MIEYTLAFLYTSDLKKILLLKRKEHEFHAFKYNGIGGKIILGESPLESITRETQEETNLEIEEKNWRFVGILKAPSWKVWIFATKLKQKPDEFPDIREGTLEWHAVESLPQTIVSNLTWLVPLSLDIFKNPELQSIVGWYIDPITRDTVDEADELPL